MDETFSCDNCNSDVTERDNFCPSCGSLFTKTNCENHENIEAYGICLICKKACCPDCGLEVNKIFLCNEHSNIEIYQAMARVFGSSDSLEIDYFMSILEQENLYPFKYSRKASAISLGGSDYTLFRASGDSSGNLINEIKIMIPLNEFLEAQKLIEDINIK